MLFPNFTYTLQCLEPSRVAIVWLQLAESQTFFLRSLGNSLEQTLACNHFECGMALGMTLAKEGEFGKLYFSMQSVPSGLAKLFKSFKFKILEFFLNKLQNGKLNCTKLNPSSIKM